MPSALVPAVASTTPESTPRRNAGMMEANSRFTQDGQLQFATGEAGETPQDTVR
jgi:hypothetical protein